MLNVLRTKKLLTCLVTVMVIWLLVLPGCVTPAAPVEDCVSFDYGSAQVKEIDGRWKIVIDGMWLLDFGGSQAEATEALGIIQHYAMNKQCFVGRPDPSMEYYLADGQGPSGSLAGEDCVSFDPAAIEVKSIDGSWKIVEGDHYIMDFDGEEQEARTAFGIVRKYGFTNICFVGRPDPPMTYFRL
jgi:hypothetical protein